MRLDDIQYSFNADALLSLVEGEALEPALSRVSEGLEKEPASFESYFRWMLRDFKAAKHVIGAAIFFAQSERLAGTSMANLASYTGYYSFHHATCAALVLLPQIPFKKAVRIGHADCLRYLEQELCAHGSMPSDTPMYYDHALALREAFSYRLPLRGLQGDRVFGAPDGMLSYLRVVVPGMCQLANLFTHALYVESRTKFGDYRDQLPMHHDWCTEEFHRAIEIRSRRGSETVDEGDAMRLEWLLRKSRVPMPLDFFVYQKFCEDLVFSWEEPDVPESEADVVADLIGEWLA